MTKRLVIPGDDPGSTFSRQRPMSDEETVSIDAVRTSPHPTSRRLVHGRGPRRGTTCQQICPESGKIVKQTQSMTTQTGQSDIPGFIDTPVTLACRGPGRGGLRLPVGDLGIAKVQPLLSQHAA